MPLDALYILRQRGYIDFNRMCISVFFKNSSDYRGCVDMDHLDINPQDFFIGFHQWGFQRSLVNPKGGTGKCYQQL
jgi:hypothetical protein